MLDKLERKFGKFAIPNLMNYVIGAYILGYFLQIMSAATNANSFLAMLTLEPYLIIHNLQIWRILSWVLIPPSRSLLFAVIMMYFYWQLGRTLENSWGTFRFNLYMFGGMFLTVLGAFVFYGLFYLATGIEYPTMGAFFSTDYINMSIFLAFSLLLPDMQVMLYFLIPIKMKWLAYLYVAMLVLSVYSTPLPGKVAIISSMLNFIIFYFANKKSNFSSGARRNNRGRHTTRSFTWTSYRGTGQGASGQTGSQSTSGAQANREAPRPKPSQISRHKCAICGRTELTNPELEFRFCSKCNGNYEYCSDHLFSHSHVE